jgi:hypothetical protein
MKDHPLMTEKEMESTVMVLPEIRHRVDMASQWYRIKERLIRLEMENETLRSSNPAVANVLDGANQEIVKPVSDESAAKPQSGEAKLIVEWLYRISGDAQTVRAIHTRKLAQRIEKGEFRLEGSAGSDD